MLNLLLMYISVHIERFIVFIIWAHQWESSHTCVLCGRLKFLVLKQCRSLCRPINISNPNTLRDCVCAGEESSRTYIKGLQICPQPNVSISKRSPACSARTVASWDSTVVFHNNRLLLIFQIDIESVDMHITLRRWLKGTEQISVLFRHYSWLQFPMSHKIGTIRMRTRSRTAYSNKFEQLFLMLKISSLS